MRNYCVLAATPMNTPKTCFSDNAPYEGVSCHRNFHSRHHRGHHAYVQEKKGQGRLIWECQTLTFYASNRQHVGMTCSLNRQTKAKSINLCKKSEVYTAENLTSIILCSSYKVTFHKMQRAKNNTKKNPNIESVMSRNKKVHTCNSSL